MATRRKRAATKVHTLVVTLVAPSWMTAAMPRREVKTLINEQCGFLSHGPNYEDATVRARKVAPASGAVEG